MVKDLKDLKGWTGLAVADDEDDVRSRTKCGAWRSLRG
jgi:hypothetical protein